MRVVMAANWWYRRGGAGSVMLDEAAALEGLGHEVVPFAARHPENIPTPYDRYFPPFTETETGGASLSLPARLGAAIDLIHDRQAGALFTRLLADTRPDLVHLHNPSRQLSPSIVAAARRAHVPVVITLHDFSYVCPQGQMLKGDREACRPPNCIRGNVLHAVTNTCVKGSRVVSTMAATEHLVHRATRAYVRGVVRLIAPSRYLSGVVRSSRMSLPPIRVVPNGVADIGPLTRPGAGRHLLFQGRLSREKGLGVLVEAARLVPDVPIVVAGDGPMRDEVAASAPASVRLVGHRSIVGLRDDLDAAVAVVSPSTWPENAPLAIIEALRAGRPVIASDIGGQGELVSDRSGVLVAPGDAGELARAMQALWVDRDRADRLGDAARLDYLERFTHDRHMSSLLAVYAEAISDGQPDVDGPAAVVPRS